jgi:hypothetical protein
MVIVILVGIMAVIAAGTVIRARTERLLFDYARRIHGIVHRAGTRAIGRGSPHLVLMDAGAAARGRVIMFEGTDGFNTGAAAPSPDRDNACRSHDWTWATGGWAPGLTDGTYLNEPLEGIELGDTAVGAINVTEDVTATYIVNGAAVGAVAICYSRSGVAFVGTGGSVGAAVTNMQGQLPFTGVVEISVIRHTGGAPVGQARKVIVASGAAPRVRPCDPTVAPPGCL